MRPTDLLPVLSLVAGARPNSRLHGRLLRAPDFFLHQPVDPLSNADAPVIAAHYVKLIQKYSTELAEQNHAAERYRHIVRKTATERQMRCIGQIGKVEAAMLYIMLREHKPTKMIEIGALCGSSTRWILAALEANGGGQLVTYDLHPYAPIFVSQAFTPLVIQRRWSFVKGDAIFALSGPDTVFDADSLFIDALHRNQFAKTYTDQLLRKAAANISRPLPVFVHDIFSPFMLREFKPCQRAMSPASLDEEVNCIRKAARQASGSGLDLIYSEQQPAGEGVELMSWLARTSRSKALVTFSMYAAPYLSIAVAHAMNRPDNAANNNPSIFFLLEPDRRRTRP